MHYIIQNSVNPAKWFLPGRGSLAEDLGAHGYEVAVAETGAHALSFLERLPIDLLLTDLRLPNLTGLALLHEVRARRPEVQVIIMSAFGDIPTAVKAIQDVRLLIQRVAATPRTAMRAASASPASPSAPRFAATGSRSLPPASRRPSSAPSRNVSRLDFRRSNPFP